MNPLRKKQKLYCYVDETGQDKAGRFFLVALVVTGSERDEMLLALESIEQESGKGISKWKKTSAVRRSAYLRMVMQTGLFEERLFSNRRDYREMTIEATSEAIREAATPAYEVTVLIDGLGKTERFAVGLALRRLGLSVEQAVRRRLLKEVHRK